MSLTTKQIPAKRKFFEKQVEVIPLPNFIETQVFSYNWFLREGLRDLLDEISPIIVKNLSLRFLDYKIEKPKFDEATSRERNINYEAPLKVKVELRNNETKKTKKQEIFLGDFPCMTHGGTFIINGVERAIVNQLTRSSGVFFVVNKILEKEIYGARIIPVRGAWLEIETSSSDIISVKIDRGRKIPITIFLRALGFSTNQELFDLFKDVNTDSERDYIKKTIEKDPTRTAEEGLIELYKRVRPGDLVTVDNARSFLETKFFNFRYYDLGRTGRYKINQRLGLKIPLDIKNRILKIEDIIKTTREIISLNNGIGEADDIDHLSNRRVRTVGELIQNKFRVGLLRIERIIKDRLSVCDPEIVTPASLINARPIIAAIQEFFTSSRLSQFLDQTNPLSEIAHKRRLSAMGPGGLSRERAGFEVRDVHRSHYGRICPIETPEGPNIGLVNSLACYARVNEFGFLETPYRKVVSKVPNKLSKLIGRTTWKPVLDPKTGREVVAAGTKMTVQIAKKIVKLDLKEISVNTFVSSEIVYLDAFSEETAITTPATTPLNEKNEFIDNRVLVRKYGTPDMESKGRVDYMDVSPKQIVGLSAALIPFLEHDDPTRASMGSNMQRQAVPLVRAEAPLVGTGIEETVGKKSGYVILASESGIVEKAVANEVIVRRGTKIKRYKIPVFLRSNQGTCIHYKTVVEKGQKVKGGDVLADSYSTDSGEIALGQNILVAFISWEGGNFEDAILISERVVRKDLYTSCHIEHFQVEVRDTKLGPEMITCDIPNVGEEALKNLDKKGIVRIGAEVKAEDILVGKITPKGETELTAEERLLRAIFGEKAKDVKDTSLRLPHGKRGKVINIKIFSKDKGDKLAVGVSKMIEVSIAQLRKITVGDKMAGRHGNKGVISKVVSQENMPFLADGTSIDIVLNPLGVSSRMNLGQILETHLGWPAKKLGYKVASPALSGISWGEIKKELKYAGLPADGKTVLYDGQTGEPFCEKVTVGYVYMMKLIHMVEDKIHARSIGPYSLVTQQPLGGKAQFGGQRFGEMEVWALEAYGAAYTLQEMLTIKSDDILGRAKAYESIIKGEEIRGPAVPESFKVLIKELQSLGLSVDLISKETRVKARGNEVKR
jgi:DNA-directed RNA polymerase subunit beta